MSACRVCASPDRLEIEAWLRRRVPYREVRSRLAARGVKLFNSSLSAHRRHAGLAIVEPYQLRGA